MIEYNGTNYELRYSIKRIEMIEKATDKSLISIMKSGAPTLFDLCACIAYGLKIEGASGYISPQQGMEIAENKLKEGAGSYELLAGEVSEAVERDCPFFFPKG